MNNLLIFVSYSTKDAETYHIKEICGGLTKKENIKDVLYWQEDMHDNIIGYMEKNVAKCDIFLIFCSPNALNSIPVQKEYHAAEALNKTIIPIFTNPDDIPALLSPVLGVQFDNFDLQKNIDEISSIIMKKSDKKQDEEKLSKDIQINKNDFQKLNTNDYFESLIKAIEFLIKVKKTKSLLISDIALRMGLNSMAVETLLEELIYENRIKGIIEDKGTPLKDDDVLVLEDNKNEDNVERIIFGAVQSYNHRLSSKFVYAFFGTIMALVILYLYFAKF